MTQVEDAQRLEAELSEEKKARAELVQTTRSGTSCAHAEPFVSFWKVFGLLGYLSARDERVPETKDLDECSRKRKHIFISRRKLSI